MHRSGFIFLLISLLFINCGDEDKVAEEIAKMNVDLKILRFDQEFAKARPSDIPVLKKAYPYLFPARYTDSVWEAKLRDTLQIELRNEVERIYPDLEELSTDLELLFKHIEYYFPKYGIPTVITMTNDVDYRNRVILADTLLLIGLDNYLGEEHRFYEGIERYIAAGLNEKYMVSDIAGAFGHKVIRYPTDRSFLARMIYYGKGLYLKDKLIPFLKEAVRIGYSEEELDWARENEERIWRYFIERELLYSTDGGLEARFLAPAPFSKFRLELDNESPGRLGRYVGWQIVKAFMDKNDVTLPQLLNLPAEEIFKKSNYKPKK